MAKTAPDTPTPAPKRLGDAISRWFRGSGASEIPADPTPPGGSLFGGTQGDWQDGLSDPVSTAFLAGGPGAQARSRQQIYEKWQGMVNDPVISSAMRLHVTAALGGHETKGDMVFLEEAPDLKDAKLKALAANLAADLQPLLNKVAPTLAFCGCTFGDGYGRIYSEEGSGVRDIVVDELVYPPLVQPFERANTTVGYKVATGERFQERLSTLQMVRMKLPRQIYVPQARVIEKSLLVSLRVDRIEELPIVPALAGGSFLTGAEDAYDKFSAAWAGLVGQRVQDSVNETLVTVQQTGATPEQRRAFKKSLTDMMAKTNAYLQRLVSAGRYAVGRIWHFVPVHDEKQMVALNGAASAGRASSLTIDDVMMAARFLAGSLGMDLSMLGFADQLGGGLGEGGFFRVSAQSAERSRMIRASLSDAIDHICSVHALMKYGIDTSTLKVKPWVVTYYSGISALEKERASTEADKLNGGALLVQTLTQIRDLGLSEEATTSLLKDRCGLDEAQAKLYAKALAAAKPADDGSGFGGGAPSGGFPGRPAGPGGNEFDGQPGDESEGA